MKLLSLAAFSGYCLLVGTLLLVLLGIVALIPAVLCIIPGTLLLFWGLLWGGIPPTELSKKWVAGTLTVSGGVILLTTLWYSNIYSVKPDARVGLLIFGAVLIALGFFVRRIPVATSSEQ